jgi:hypothetical protein
VSGVYNCLRRLPEWRRRAQQGPGEGCGRGAVQGASSKAALEAPARPAPARLASQHLGPLRPSPWTPHPPVPPCTPCLSLSSTTVSVTHFLVCAQGATKSMVIDHAYLLEGHFAHELPEALMWALGGHARVGRGGVGWWLGGWTWQRGPGWGVGVRVRVGRVGAAWGEAVRAGCRRWGPTGWQGGRTPACGLSLLLTRREHLHPNCFCHARLLPTDVRVCLCRHVHMCTCAHVCVRAMYTHTHTHTHVNTHQHPHARTHTHPHTHAHTHMHTHAHAHALPATCPPTPPHTTPHHTTPPQPHPHPPQWCRALQAPGHGAVRLRRHRPRDTHGARGPGLAVDPRTAAAAPGLAEGHRRRRHTRMRAGTRPDPCSGALLVPVLSLLAALDPVNSQNRTPGGLRLSSSCIPATHGAALLSDWPAHLLGALLLRAPATHQGGVRRGDLIGYIAAESAGSSSFWWSSQHHTHTAHDPHAPRSAPGPQIAFARRPRAAPASAGRPSRHAQVAPAWHLGAEAWPTGAGSGGPRGRVWAEVLRQDAAPPPFPLNFWPRTDA